MKSIGCSIQYIFYLFNYTIFRYCCSNIFSLLVIIRVQYVGLLNDRVEEMNIDYELIICISLL